jgi:UDP-N-acetylglucosamine diphosphorylase/glucosamine-1-phosphate N-acetyltransferase
MKIVILAGGVGKRIAPLGVNKPKSMFQIMGRPIIHHVLDLIRNSGVKVEEVVIITGSNESQIRVYIEARGDWGFPFQFVVQQQPLGQANALLSARSLLQNDFLVMNANDIYDSSLVNDLVGLGQKQSLDVGLVGRYSPNPNNFGVMEFNKNGKPIRVVEKPDIGQEPSNTIVVGLYYLSSKFWAALDTTKHTGVDDQFERAYNLLLKQGNGNFIKYDGYFASYKYPWDLLSISDLLLHKKCVRQIDDKAIISPLAYLDGEVIIGPGAKIMEFAVIRGPAYIGENNIIGNHTLLRGGVSLGSACVVGSSTEISHSIFGNNCWTHKNFIGDSIISDNCSFGAGTITANLRFDEKPISVSVSSGRISSNLDHFGIIMAEDCRTGCNSVLSPGIKIGPNSIVGPGVVLRHDLLSNKFVRNINSSYQECNNEINLHDFSREERMRMLRK